MTASPPAPGPAPGALVLFSGGQDSAVCLAWALQRHPRVETVGFDYGQRHAVEMTARLEVRQRMAALDPDWASRLGPDHIIDLTSFGAVARSALTADEGFATRPDGLPTAFVPGRNLAFFVYAAALADQRGLRSLVGGMCQTDFSGYPDCRRDTLQALERAINLGMAAEFAIETPLMDLDKAETWDLARRLGGEDLVQLILEHSHTCYLGVREARHDWGYGCGTCPACELRQGGWRRHLASIAA